MLTEPVLTEPMTRADGAWVVPGNRWDLIAAETPDPVDVSVVIPYFDGQHGLDLILAALARQTHPRTRLQVVVADDGSASPPDVRDADVEVLVVRQEDRGFRAAAARNLGAAHADGQVMVLLDGDTVPEPGYVAAISRLPALLPDALVGGRRRYAELADWTPGQLGEWFDGGSAPPALTEPDWLTREYRRTRDLLDVQARSYQHLIGAVLACHREMFDDISGFDESFVGYGGEDYDFSYRAFNAGAVLGYVPDAVAWHIGPDWSGRTPDPADQLAQKNRELRVLAPRIPELSLRGRGQVYPVPDVIVEVDASGWGLGSAVVCLRSLLSAVDAGVWLDGECAAVAEWFADDPRVRVGTPAPDVAARARVQMTLTGPVTADDGFGELLRRLTDDGIGRLVIGSVAVATSTRAARRARRHGLPLDRLFPVAHAASGLAPITEEPSLAAVFGGWA